MLVIKLTYLIIRMGNETSTCSGEHCVLNKPSLSPLTQDKPKSAEDLRIESLLNDYVRIKTKEKKELESIFKQELITNRKIFKHFAEVKYGETIIGGKKIYLSEMSPNLSAFGVSYRHTICVNVTGVEVCAHSSNNNSTVCWLELCKKQS